MNFLIDFQDVGNGILVAIRTLLLKICEPIYSLIIFCFDTFENFGKVRLFAESDTISQIYTRIGLILGLFMVFRLTFAGIQYLIDPDKMTDTKEGIGNIVKRVLIVVVLLGSTRALFDFAYEFQDKLIDSRIVDRLVLGSSNTEKESSGTNLAWYTFSQFYTINNNVAEDDRNRMNCEKMLKSGDNGEDEGSIYSEFRDNHILDNAEYCLNLQSQEKYDIDGFDNEKAEINIINFNGFICVAVGIALLWTIITYTIQVGIRVFQLAYLELIAPIPIMMYLMPSGEEKLKKWGQQCLTTFLDFFIRIAIMDFVILVSNTLVDVTKNSSILNEFSATNFWGESYIVVIFIVALLLFAKKIPNLLKEIFPSSGGAGFSFDFGLKSLKGAATFGAGAAVGAIGGAATGIKYGSGTAGGRLGGALTGLARGALGGAKTKGNILANAGKGMGNQRAAMQRAYNRNNDGSSFWGRTFGAGDAARTKAAFDEELSFYDAYDQNTKIIDAELEKNSMVQAAMAKKQALLESYQNGSATPNAADIKKADDLIKQAKKTALQVEMGRGPTGKLKTALDNAEAIRAKGVQLGYSGFGTTSISTGTAADRAQAYNDNKDSAVNETNNIKGAGGTRNKEYKEAEANAKYARDK